MQSNLVKALVKYNTKFLPQIVLKAMLLKLLENALLGYYTKLTLLSKL